MALHPLAGQPAPESSLADPARLVTAYYAEHPDPQEPTHRVSFGTSGHRGSSLNRTFNERHILAITQAICDWRRETGIDGPLFLGMDSHALSEPATITALEVLAANGVHILTDARHGPSYFDFTPTPALSHAILRYNVGKKTGLADGIVVTPSHNPPEDGGFKYNPPHGGPADSATTKAIQDLANQILDRGLQGVKRVPLEKALKASTTQQHDFLGEYASDLEKVLDIDIIRDSKIRIGADPLGGAGIRYWGAIAEMYGLNLTVVNPNVDCTFRFMTLDWDGRIRMDPSSPYAMKGLIQMKDRFDISVACDTDHDRHGIVTRSAGLLSPNQYLSVCVEYLCDTRLGWKPNARVGKTVVTTSMIDRVAAKAGVELYEVPVGFKWFVDGLHNGSLVFGGEESAGSSFLTKDRKPWSTDKDGIIAALLAAEITARKGRDPGELYENLCREHGRPFNERIDAAADRATLSRLGKLSAQDIRASELAGEPIERILTTAPGDGQPIGGVKVTARSGWFAVRPSGTEDIYKVYAESFQGREHLSRIQVEAQAMVEQALGKAAV